MKKIISMALSLVIMCSTAQCFAGTGYLYWPVQKSTGLSGCYGDKRGHKAIDITAKNGTPVMAVADGRVIAIRKKCRHNYGKRRNCCGDGYGKWVKISHYDKIKGKSVITKYNHLSRVCVKKGQAVKAWDTIGKVGSTGYSRGYHLDYQVMLDGKLVNPGLYTKVPAKLHYTGSGRTRSCCIPYIRNLKKSLQKVPQIYKTDLDIAYGSYVYSWRNVINNQGYYVQVCKDNEQIDLVRLPINTCSFDIAKYVDEAGYYYINVTTIGMYHESKSFKSDMMCVRKNIGALALTKNHAKIMYKTIMTSEEILNEKIKKWLCNYFDSYYGT